MLVGPGEKVEKGQVVYSLIKDQQSKWTTWPTTQFTNIMVKGVGTCAPQPTNSRSQQNRRASFHQRSTIQLNNTVYQRSDYQSFHVKVWARVHHSRPIPDHLLQAAIKSLNVAPDKIEPAPRISDVLMETWRENNKTIWVGNEEYCSARLRAYKLRRWIISNGEDNVWLWFP